MIVFSYSAVVRLQNSRVFFLKISKEIGKAWRKSLTRAKRVRRIFSVSPQSRSLFSASFQTFCLTARAYLNTQKYGLFCSLCCSKLKLSTILIANIAKSARFVMRTF